MYQHLGHARNYVSTDIIRRILQDYFHFDVNFVMNITDVDDKIILAARQQYLLSRWLEKSHDVNDTVRDATDEAFRQYVKAHLPLLDSTVSVDRFAAACEHAYGHVLRGQSLESDGAPPGDREAKVKMHLRTAQSAAEALNLTAPTLHQFRDMTAGVLLPFIDQREKHTVNRKDHDLFTVLTKKYEQRFFSDMAALNVRAPDKLTRVTEYGPQIVDFVKRIQDNGFGYEHDGSVYYDTHAWEASGGHYARLEPWNRHDKDLQQDGEGSLAVKATNFNRSGADFALWKALKPGEPSWNSPWGEGRPGWHIECSAMASDVLGKQFDIHSGGIDLAFPHHDNELAQSEAYWAKSGKESEQWVNYFLHMGHLSIQGSKMSKSLKNFTTVREALAKGEWTPRGLRIVFLLGAWRDGLEITGEVVKAGVAWEDRVDNFFLKVKDVQRRTSSTSEVDGATNGVRDLSVASAPDSIEEVFQASKEKFDVALRDSFDTPGAMRIISDLIGAYNTLKDVDHSTTIAIGRWISEMVIMFGLDATPNANEVGWSGLDIQEEAKPSVYALAQLRDQIREQAKSGAVDPATAIQTLESRRASGGSNAFENALADFRLMLSELQSKRAPSKDYLAACDYVRDTMLWDLGIYLEDRENLPALVRPLSQSLRADRANREAAAAAKSASKSKAKADADAAEKDRLEKGKLSPLDMFRTAEYSAWDEDGLPTIDAEGKEVAKSRTKKLKKDWERQKKLHEAWQAAA